jgi:hypothetical protein
MIVIKRYPKGGNLSRTPQDPLIISFYTEGTPYQLEALSLISSCNELGIEIEVDSMIPQGSWERNCAIKPFFIRHKLQQRQRPVFWVDADAVFRKRPDFSFLQQCDLSFREMKRFSHDRRFRYCSGSLFINYTPKGLAFVDKWCAYCQKKIDMNEDLKFLDQVSLVDLIEAGEDVKIHPLPISYVKIFDLDAHEVAPGEVVVEHYQASRKYRHWKG